MKVLKALINLVFMTFLLTSCASLSESECKTGDWKYVGMEDGTQGFPLSELDSHRDACSEYNITIDSKAYTAGRKSGLTEYCRLEIGYTVGSQGKTYHNVCSNKEFSEKYYLGKKVYGLDQQIKSKNTDVGRLENEYNAGQDSSEKLHIRARIKGLNQDIIDLEKKRVALKMISGQSLQQVVDTL